MRLAFLVSGSYDYDRDRTCFEDRDTVMIGVSGLKEAEEVASALALSGFDAIELSGAFGVEGARRVREAAGPGVHVGYVIPFED